MSTENSGSVIHVLVPSDPQNVRGLSVFGGRREEARVILGDSGSPFAVRLEESVDSDLAMGVRVTAHSVGRWEEGVDVVIGSN